MDTEVKAERFISLRRNPEVSWEYIIECDSFDMVIGPFNVRPSRKGGWDYELKGKGGSKLQLLKGELQKLLQEYLAFN